MSYREDVISYLRAEIDSGAITRARFVEHTLSGKVDVYDLVALAKVGTVDVGQQAGGIAFWKMEPAPK